MLINKRIIPILLLKDRVLHKTIQFKKPTYVGDPINTLRIFNEKEADEIILLDITKKTQTEGPSFSALQQIAGEVYSPISYGGGITNLAQAEKILRLGFEKISLCTSVYTNPILIKECVREFGSQAIVASVDIKKNFWGKRSAYIGGGTKKIQLLLNDYIEQINDLEVGEVIVNDVSREGTLLGYDLDFFQNMVSLFDSPVIASGGAKSLLNISELFKIVNVCAAGIGSLFVYHGVNRAVLVTYPSHKEKLGVLNGN
jgi:cyclase